MKYINFLILLLVSHVNLLNGQDTIVIEKLFKTPGRSVDFPIHYDLFLPSDNFSFWTLKMRTPIESIDSCGNDVMNSQFFGDNQRIRLDNSTIIQNPKNLTGTWRSISIRYIEIKDSISFISHQVFRHDSILGTKDNFELIMMFKDNKFCEYRKSGRKSKYHKSVYDYRLVDGRILHFSKIFGGTEFIGIDEDDIMIMQNGEVITNSEEGKYKVVITRIIQMFFERISKQTGDF